jgi:hypothetical protein
MKKNKIKISNTQKEIITLMREGWEMAKSNTMNARSWIQKNGIGKGGETKNLTVSTFISLCEKGIIEQKEYGFPSSTFKLTELGMTIEL